MYNNNLTLKDIRKHIDINNKSIDIEGINHLYEQSNRYKTNKSENKSENESDTQSDSMSLQSIYESLINKSSDSCNVKENNDDLSNNDLSNDTLSENTSNIKTLQSIFNEDNDIYDNYYIYKTNTNNSFLQSILLCIDPEYRMLSNKTDYELKLKRMEISSNAHMLIKSKLKNIYKKRKIKFNDIPSKLFGDTSIERDNDLKIFLTDFFDINIVLFNLTDRKYKYINEWMENAERTYVFIEHKSRYEPVLNSNGGNTDAIHKYILKNYDTYEKRLVLNNINKYKIKELQDIATSLGISITYIKQDKIKKKLKLTLYNEIKNYT